MKRMGMGLSTINTVLKLGGSRADAEKLCRITGYPDLQGSPDLIESTDFLDYEETYVPGVKTQDTVEFSANYNPEDFSKLAQNENVLHQYYRLEMGEDGDDGIFVWLGSHGVKVNGSGVNEVRTMTITCVPETGIHMEKDSGALGNENGSTLVTNKGNPIGFIEII